jgi:hypothetical protein
MPIEFRDFTIGGERSGVPGKLPDNKESRWWMLKGPDAANTISGTLNLIRDNQSFRATQWIVSSRLYGNLAPTTLAGVSFSKLAASQPALRDRISYNLVQSVVDTAVARITRNRPRPFFLTNDGDYNKQREAKKLNTFLEGVFYENSTYDLGVQVFRDAAVWGDGFIHVFPKANRVCHERVMASEIFVDDVEALYGMPRQMHRIKQVDRQVLFDWFPDDADKIAGAKPSRTEENGRSIIADMLTVRESWHLPSGPNADDGKHCITIDGAVLGEVEPWPHQWFPFARVQWAPRMYGYFGQGLAEQLQNIQLEINKLLWVIQRSFHLSGTFKVFIENGSKIVKEHLNNDVGSIVNYTGTPPMYVVPPTVAPEIFSHLQNLINKGYEQAGISQLAASSLKPEGLNSGRAIREYNDIQQDRLHTPAKMYETMFMDVGRLSIETVKMIAEDQGEYKVRTPGRKSIANVDWKDIKLNQDDYVMQCYPVSSLPNDPAGRLQTIQEYAQAGFLTPRQARRLLDFPDLDQVESLANAEEDYLTSVLDRMVDDGKYTSPDPLDDLALAQQLALEYYAKGKFNNLRDDRLDLIRRFLDQIKEVQQDMAQAAMQQAAALQAAVAPQPGATAMPLAPPIPMQPSDLVPNVPVQ